MRRTKKELLNAFHALCRACGKHVGTKPGQWRLAANSPGDGITRYTIEETYNELGGVTNPLSQLAFLGRSEACQALWFAARAAEIARNAAERKDS